MINPAGGSSRSPLLSWQFFFVQILLFALAAVCLNKPVGSISGQIAMEQEGFSLYTYDMKDHKVYATAVGPRDGNEEERGVWVDKNGHFEIDGLPVGEYDLKLRVPGFSTTHKSGIFVAEAKDTSLGDPVLLQISEPSVDVGTNARVFMTKDKPSFWAHAQGSSNMKVKLYRKDLLKILGSEDEKKLGVEISADLGLYKPYGAEHKEVDIFKELAPVQTWTRNLQPDSEDWSYETFKCDKSLPPGDYFAIVEASNFRHQQDKSILWFTVTDIGIIVKQDFNKTVVRAIDLATLKPVAGVVVEVRDRSNKLELIFDHSKAAASAVTKAATATTTATQTAAQDSAQTSAQTSNRGLAHSSVAEASATAVASTASASKSRVTTGADGFAEISIGKALEAGFNSNLIICGFKGDQHAYGGMTLSRSVGDQHKTYFYTERPIYRLGQTVYFRGICRDTDGNGFKNPGEMPLTISLEDPDNASIWSGKVKTNKFGSFHGVLDLPKDGKTGAYQVNLTYPDGSNTFERIEIDEYRKPEYKVDVYPLETRVNAGSKARARIKAMYYFGAPVTNAKVKYSIYSQNDWFGRYRLKSRPDYYSYFDDWDNGSNDYSYGGDFVSEGTVQTDATGEAVVEFDTKAGASELEAVFDSGYEDKKYKVDVEVTDISRLSVLSSGFVSVTPGDFTLFVEPKSYIAKVGEKIESNLRAVDYEGHPVANKLVKMQLLRRVWDGNEHVYRGLQEFETLNVNTDKDGNAHVAFSTQAKYLTDTYYIVASAKDAEAHQVRSSTSLWVVSENSPYSLSNDEAQKEPVTVKLDKEVYKPGETVRAMISAPITGKEGAQAIVAIEGERIYSYKAVNLTASATLVEIPVDKSFAPNVYVTVTFVSKKRQFFNTSQMIKVSPQSNFLTISVSPDKKKYRPGDMATYTLKAVDNDGKPAANVELAMGVVDESIYAIRPEFVQDIRKFFYSQRSNNVTTICSFPEEYSGGPNKIEPRVRKDFRDTAAWFPSLVTNKDGIVTAKFKMPDNLTTWRATVRAVSLNAEVGWTLQKTVSTQDLIVRLALPRFFCQGDKGEISAVVHNYSDQMQNISVSLAVSPEFQIEKKLLQTVKLAPEKVAKVSWPTTILKSGTGTISVKAVGQTAGDAMETKLPIRPLGVPMYISRSGYLSDEEQTVDLPLEYPADAAPGSVDLTVHTASSSLSPVLGNFSSLIDYPYGCTEQTMSRLMPAVVAVKMNKKLGIPLAKADLAKFADVYKLSMDKLDEYQHADGGWGWWANDQSNPYLTSLVLEGYKLLDEAGYKIDPERKKRGLSWLGNICDNLQKQLEDPSLLKSWWHENEEMTDLAKAVYVQSLHGVKLKANLVKWVSGTQVMNHLNPESLAYFSMAFHAAGNNDGAQTMFKRLLYLANADDSNAGKLLNWDRCSDMYKKLAESEKWYYWYYSYRFTGVETTALALRACVALEPEQTERIESIKSYILTERGKDGWGNTKTTAEVFKAFMEDELSRTREAGNSDFKADLACAGKALLNLNFDKSSISAPEQICKLDLKAGEGKPKLHKQGPGRLYWTCISKYYKQIKAGDSSVLPSNPSGLTIKREFARLKAVYDAENNVSFTEEPLTGPVKAGETILMKVKLVSPITVPYVLLEVPLPSGAEVVKDDPKEQIASRGSTDRILSKWWWTHQDIMDDHVAFFVSSYHDGPAEIRTMVRMELPGKFQMNPVTLEGMYTNNLRGYSNADQIEVVE